MGRDLRYAVRGMRRAPGFASAAILSLALGIGAATAIFSVADALMLRPLPYPDSARLVTVWEQLPKLGISHFPVNEKTFRQYSAQDTIFEPTAGFLLEDATLVTGAEPEHVMLLNVTPAMFPLLGVTPALGRAFHDDDRDVALLSYDLYLRRFASDPLVLGRTIRLDNRIVKIAGVLPRGFEFGDSTGAPDLWVPMTPPAEAGSGAVNMLARLRPGVSVAAAQQALNALKLHATDRGFSVRVVSLHEDWLGEFRTGAVILLAAVGAVLLIVLVNVANLMLAHSVSREKEFAVRRALGASETRLARQRIIEASVLAIIGGAIGTLASVWAIPALIAFSPARLPAAAKIGLDARALGIALALSAVVSVLFGLAPLFAERRLHLHAVRARPGAAALLVTVEAALATLLLIEAGLLLKSFNSLSHVNAGFNGENLLTMEVSLPAYRYPQERTQVEFFSQVRQHLSVLPGVLAATSGSRLPLNGSEIMGRGSPFSIEGRPPVPETARFQTVDLDYFRTLQIPLIAGRVFSAADSDTAPPAAIVNQTLARRISPDGDALGRRIVAGGAWANPRWMTIVGIAGDVKAAALDEQTLPHVYMPLAQHPSLWMAVAVRTAGDPLHLARQVVGAIRSIDPEEAPTAINSMRERAAGSISRPRFETGIVGLFASVALFLAAVGIFGVVAHATARRTREVGIRMALGADRGHLLRQVILRGMRPVLAGIIVGIAGALALSSFVAALLFHVRPADPVIIALAATLLAAVAVAACLVPAWRAARVNPVIALRAE